MQTIIILNDKSQIGALLIDFDIDTSDLNHNWMFQEYFTSHKNRIYIIARNCNKNAWNIFGNF